MPAEFAVPPPLMWRVERTSPPLRFSRLPPEDAALETGNRFDIVGVGVLYAATDPVGAFAETMAGFRPSTGVPMWAACLLGCNRRIEVDCSTNEGSENVEQYAARQEGSFVGKLPNGVEEFL